MKKIIYVLFAISIIAVSCSEDEVSSEIQKQPLPEFSVINVSQDSNWDYWVLGKEDYYLIEANAKKSLPKSAVYHSESLDENFTILFNDQGNLDKVYFNEHIFIFKNFNGNFVDLGVVYPDGTVETFKKLETENYNWDTTTLSSKNRNSKNFERELIRWTGHTIAGIPCALSVAAALPTGGLSLLGAGFTCGLFLNRLVGDILETDFNIENDLNEVLEVYDYGATAGNCLALNAFDCAYGVLSIAYDELAERLNEIETNENEIESVIALLESMTVLVQNINHSSFTEIKGIIENEGFVLNSIDHSDDFEIAYLINSDVFAMFDGSQTWNGNQNYSTEDANAIIDFVRNGGKLYIQSKRRYDNILSQLGVTTYGNDGGSSGFDWGLIRSSATILFSHEITNGLSRIVGDVGAEFDLDSNWEILGKSTEGENLLARRGFGDGEVVLWYAQRSYRNAGPSGNVYETSLSEGDNRQFYKNIFNYFYSMK